MKPVRFIIVTPYKVLRVLWRVLIGNPPQSSYNEKPLRLVGLMCQGIYLPARWVLPYQKRPGSCPQMIVTSSLTGILDILIITRYIFISGWVFYEHEHAVLLVLVSYIKQWKIGITIKYITLNHTVRPFWSKLNIDDSWPFQNMPKDHLKSLKYKS